MLQLNNIYKCMSAGQQLTPKLYENRLLLTTKAQETYDITAAANRLTSAVHITIAKHSQLHTVGTTCLRALPK